MYEVYVRQEQKFSIFHYLTRRLESLAGLMILFGLLMLALYYFDFKELEGANLHGVIWFDMVNSAFVALLVVKIFTTEPLPKMPKMPEIGDNSDDWQKLQEQIGNSKEMVEGINSLTSNVILVWAVVLLLGLILNKQPFYVLGIHSFIWGAMLFAGAYSANRKYGYTRACMRNGFFAVRVEVLHHQLINDEECIGTISAELAELVVEAKAQAYQDTVNDYIEVNNSIIKWLSSKKFK